MIKQKLQEKLKKLHRAQRVLRVLNRIGINTSVIEHEEIVTCEESKVIYDKFYDESEYTLCKNVLIRDKKGKNFFLVILPMDKEVDLSMLREIFKTSKLGLATDENLLDILDTERGSVSLFSIINDYQKEVKVLFDESVFDKELLAFHPNYSGMTLMVKREETYRFISQSGNLYAVLMSSLIEKENKETIEKVREMAKRCVA